MRLQAAQGLATGLPPTGVILNPNVTTIQPDAVYPTQPIPAQPAAPNAGPCSHLGVPVSCCATSFNPAANPFSVFPKPVAAIARLLAPNVYFRIHKTFFAFRSN